MNRLLSILLTLFCAAPANFLFASSGEYQSLSIYFDKDKDHLTESAIEVLETIPAGSVVRLVGHTDSDGSDNYNVDLSLRRVSSAKKYLIGNGFPEHMVQNDYCGEFDPVNDNNGEPEMRWNRRVEILYRCPLAHEWVPAQKHKFLNGAGTEILGEQGTVVVIPPNAFDVPENTIVQFNLREFYALEDIIKVGLNTNSDRGMLETAGMVHLEAFAGGEELELKKPIDLGFTGIVEASPEDGYQLFNMTYDENMEPIWVEQEESTFGGKNIATIESNTQDWISTPDTNSMNTSGDADWNYAESVFCGTKPEGVRDYTLKVYGKNLTFEQMQFWQEGFKGIFESEATCFSGVWIEGTLTKTGVLFPKSSSWESESQVCHDIVMEGIRSLNPLGSSIRPDEDLDFKMYINPDLRVAGSIRYGVAREELEAMFSDGQLVIDTAGLAAQARAAEFSTNLFASTDLGWINCDRFYNSENNDVNLMVDLEPNDKSFLVFKNIKSVMWPTSLNLTSYFGNIPDGEEAVLVTVRSIDGGFELAMQDLITETGVVKPEGFAKVDKDNLDQALAALNF